MKKFCKAASVRSAIYFTVAALLFSLLVLSGNSDAELIALDPQRVICIYPFCLLFGIANTLVDNKNIDGAVRWIVHAVLTVCGAFLFLILPAGLEGSSGNFMGFALILFVYAIGVLIFAIFKKRIKTAIAEDKKLNKK